MDINSFEDAKRAHEESTQFAFELPCEHYYSDMVRIDSPDHPIFARIEIQKTMTDTNGDFKFEEAEN